MSSPSKLTNDATICIHRNISLPSKLLSTWQVNCQLSSNILPGYELRTCNITTLSHVWQRFTKLESQYKSRESVSYAPTHSRIITYGSLRHRCGGDESAGCLFTLILWQQSSTPPKHHFQVGLDRIIQQLEALPPKSLAHDDCNSSHNASASKSTENSKSPVSPHERTASAARSHGPSRRYRQVRKPLLADCLHATHPASSSSTPQTKFQSGIAQGKQPMLEHADALTRSYPPIHPVTASLLHDPSARAPSLATKQDTRPLGTTSRIPLPIKGRNRQYATRTDWRKGPLRNTRR
ncbi:hypothetical protein CC80DRAFT_584733 [Byssothecium circinans]|uniref:Uncharacterized protein n=1 Tax=Byssothecium circinans TaxID=147558 RepID=A0A6A5UFQ4_9PLEO|nr:hypothetical protein CC80DRAFT_584733 [Byssothecium circinans]